MTVFRKAVPDDRSSIVGLLQEVMRHHGIVPPEEDRLDRVVLSILTSDTRLFLVAEENGAILGMCALSSSLDTWTTTLDCELHDLVVREHARRNNIGTGLVRAAEDLARERGCTRLYLLAEAWNLETHAFYRSLGLAEKTCLYFERDLTSSIPD